MPPPAPAFSERQRAEIVSYLHWLNVNRAGLLADAGARRSARSVDWSRLAWWEFR
jgi:hypothetical protein